MPQACTSRKGSAIVGFMLARLQQRIVLLLALALILWTTVLCANGYPRLVLAGAFVVLFGHSFVLAAEFGLMAWCNRHDDVPRATLSQLFRAWVSESLWAIAVFCWRQPFRPDAVPDHLPPGAQRRGVVFVHGFVCNRGLWNPWMRRLCAEGVPFVAVNLEPVFGTIDDYPPIIEAAVQRVIDVSGRTPVVVAHSMGGLAVRAWLNAFGGEMRVRRVITIGAPHRGTVLACFAHSLNTRQLRRGGDWLRRLAASEPSTRAERFTCFFGHCDNVVFPATTATLAGADNRHLAGCAHVQMAHHEAVFDEVQRWLCADDDRPDARLPQDRP